jgi:hypothetical protein
VLGESAGQVLSVLASAGLQGRKMRPWSFVLLIGQGECEIVGKAIDVAFHLLVEPLHGHAVEVGKVRIEDDPLTAQPKYRARLDTLLKEMEYHESHKTPGRRFDLGPIRRGLGLG